MNQRIKKLRKTLDLTQQEFADRIGMKRNTVANYETNRNEPSSSVISLICREFKVSEKWLRTGEGEMFVPKEADALDELAKQYDLSDGDYVLIGKFLKLKPAERQAVITYMQDVVSSLNTGTAFPAPVSNAKPATTTPAPPAGKDIPVPATAPDLAAKVAELERQNQEMAAEIAAMKEEDTLLGLTGGFSISPTEFAGNLNPNAKK